MPNTESFILHITGDKVEVHRAKQTSANRWDAFKALVPLEEVGIPALQLGLRVIAIMPDAAKTDEYNMSYDAITQDMSPCHQAKLALVPIEPLELKGLEYLKSLPVGTRRCNDPERLYGKFMVTRVGLAWASGDVWNWDGTGHTPCSCDSWHDLWWIELCDDTYCPEWSPNEA